ncbi:hypothetical protein P3L10_009886 [Capsicum annuum]
MESYMHWRHHGEQSQMRDNNEVVYSEDKNEVHDKDDAIRTMLEEVAEGLFVNYSEETDERELYPGCKKFSNLSFSVKLRHLKVYNQWSNKSFDMLLELLKEALPADETLPKSYYDAKNMLQGLGLGYILIHACKNDCVLYWAEHKDRQECPHCGTSR